MADFQNGTPKRSMKGRSKREREASEDDNIPMTRSRTRAAAAVKLRRVSEPPVASPAAVNHSVGPHAVSKEDVYKYVLEVKQTFSSELEKYAKFVKLVLDYKAQRVDQAATINRLKELIEGHVNLMVGISKILPEDCKITSPSEVPAPVEDPLMDNKITSPLEVPAPLEVPVSVPRNRHAQYARLPGGVTARIVL